MLIKYTYYFNKSLLLTKLYNFIKYIIGINILAENQIFSAILNKIYKMNTVL